MEKRIHRRLEKQLFAKITTSDVSSFGFVLDLTKAGVGLSTNTELKPGAALSIELNIPQYKSIRIDGEVLWVRDLPVVSKHKYLVGVRIEDPTNVYSEYIEFQIKREYEIRRDPCSTSALKVEEEDVFDLLEASREKVFAKGLYIRTDTLFPMEQQIDLRLTGNDFDPVCCLGEVVASFVTDEESEKPYGAGIKIISFARGDKIRFTNYLMNLEKLYRFHWPDRP